MEAGGSGPDPSSRGSFQSFEGSHSCHTSPELAFDPKNLVVLFTYLGQTIFWLSHSGEGDFCFASHFLPSFMNIVKIEST